MSNPRRPLRVNVGFIIHEEVGYTQDFPFEVDKLQLGDDLEMSLVSGNATFGRTPQGLLFTGQFSGETTLECARCLKAFKRRLNWNMTELYAFNEKSITDSGLIVPEDAQIDLQPLVREYALLEVPINPICRPGCKGLCPVCGQDLNVRDCGHRPKDDESPFSVLKKLL